MKIKVNCIPGWLRESNRWKHLVGIAAVSFVGTILMGIGCIGGMEFKDVHHTNGDSRPIKEWDWSAWDWLDVAAGLLGGVIGQDVQLLIILLIVTLCG